jgi:hypothetical protein
MKKLKLNFLTTSLVVGTKSDDVLSDFILKNRVVFLYEPCALASHACFKFTFFFMGLVHWPNESSVLIEIH